MNTVRVRFAPSPTGHLHIGGLRTALFNWLFARHHKGTFLLRVEDTDQERSHKDYVDSQLQSLHWAGIESDEPLVFQSERMDEYQRLIKKLIDEKKAYRCFCQSTPESIGSDFYKYDGKCRIRKESEQDLKKPHVIRMKFPLDHSTISFHDLIRGEISFSIDQFDDFIIARSDGTPVYNFVVVVDDAAMNISHVIRGEDHISNTPKQIILYKALDYKVPEFAHLPLILGPSGQRLSKREAATSVLEYKHNGYLSDALCNYLVRLGWSHGDQELFSRAALISLFSLKDVGKSGALFDQEKLDWMNGHYMRETTNNILFNHILSDIEPTLLEQLGNWSEKAIEDLIGLYKERTKTLKELVDELVLVHSKSRVVSAEDLEKWITPETLEYLNDIIDLLEKASDFSADSLATSIKLFAKQKGLKFVVVAQPVRLALTGSPSGPGVFDLLALLGKDESVGRIKHFLSERQNNAK